MDLDKFFSRKIDRRRMLGNVGMMGAGAVLTACSGVMAKPPQSRDVDAAILTFALNLEYLEAAFYTAAVGRLGDLTAIGGGADVQLPDGVDGSTAIDFQALSGDAAVGAALQGFANELAAEELAHVKFLYKALADAGVTVERPLLNLDSSFKAAASVAFTAAGVTDPTVLGLPAGFDPATDFDPYANGTFFAHGAFIFEDVGVTAYKGAAKYITNAGYLEAAAGILSAEAYHAGTIRTFLYLADKDRLAFYGGLDVDTIIQAISNARDSLDGSSDLDQGITDDGGVTGGSANISVTDANGIAFSRTPAQVAAIVALSADATFSGASFFPNGLNTAGLDSDFEFLLSL